MINVQNIQRLYINLNHLESKKKDLIYLSV